MSDQFLQVIAAVDAANAHDPSPSSLDGSELTRAQLYSLRMSQTLDSFCPEASEALRIAARAQHIERWIIPRDTFEQGRTGYLMWRKQLQKHHAERTGEIMRAQGYDEAAISRVGELLRKERLKYDDEVQALEDVICLVFLAYEAPDFIAQHDDAKVRDILAKTARKMSPRGLAEAGKLALGDRLGRLLGEALAA